MATVITDIFPSERPFWEMDRRLYYHANDASGLLYGANYDSKMEVGVDALGVDDMPLIQPFDMAPEEELFPGAPRHTATGGSQNVLEVDSINLLIAVDRENGLVRRTPNVGDDVNLWGLREVISRVKDAIETNPDSPDSKDALLVGSCVRPIEFSVTANDQTELSWLVVMQCVVYPRPYLRGERTSLI